MARKSNKTSHVLHLLAGEEPVPETPEKEKETEETKEPAGTAEKEISAEETPTPLESFGQIRPEEEMPNISIISTGNSEDDPVADLIKGQLEEDFPEDILTTHPTPDTADIPADNGASDTAEIAADSSPYNVTDTSADNNSPDTATAVDSNSSDTPDSDGPGTAAADSSASDTAGIPAGGDEPGTADIPAGGNEPGTAATAADSSMSGTADSSGNDEATMTADSSASDTADIPIDNDSSTSVPAAGSAEPPAQKAEKTSDMPADSNAGTPAGGSDTVGQTEQPEPGTQAAETSAETAETETGASAAVQPDSISPDDSAAAVKPADPTDPAAVATSAASPDRPPLTQEHLDSVLYPADGHHLPNYRFVNVMEYIVKDIAIDYMKKFDMCTCERCVVDTIALTLTYCSAKYIVVDSHSVSPLLNFYSNHYLGDVTVELTKACIKIKENPRH